MANPDRARANSTSLALAKRFAVVEIWHQTGHEQAIPVMTIADTLRHFGLFAPDPRSDSELLSRFVAVCDEAAFSEILRRHGPTVYGVCRRVLGNSADADDAFQAVFLILARKAGTIRPPSMVGNWLYGVAVRTAKKARVMHAKRRARDERAATARERECSHPLPGGRGSSPDQDTLTVIDAELSTLPDIYRAAFVACDLNGRSRSEAARELGWPEGTVAARLAKARELLATRLRKRGITLGIGLLVAGVVPAATASDTLAAVRELLAVGTATAVTPAAQTLSDEVIKTMTTHNVKWLTAVGVLTFVLGTGGVALLAAPGETLPVREPIKAPIPRASTPDWVEAEPIRFKDGGKVTSLAFAPSGKTFAVCRASGQIDFYDPATRKHQQSMQVKHDPKVNANTEVGNLTALVFRPTPHPKLGDVFAVTHKNGVNFGTTNIGLLVDDAQAIEGVPPNWALKGVDPLRVEWPTDNEVVASNGADLWWRRIHQGVWEDIQRTESGKFGQRVLLASLPGESEYYVSGWERTEDGYGLSLNPQPVRSNLPISLSGHKAKVTSVVASADGERIVSADESGTLIAWEGKRLEKKFAEKRRIELGSEVVQLALAPDGKTLAVMMVKVRVEDFGSGTPRPVEWHDWRVAVYEVNGDAAKPKPVYSWGGGTKTPGVGTKPGPVSLTFSPDGKSLLAAFGDTAPAETNAKGLELLVPNAMGVKVWELVTKK